MKKKKKKKKNLKIDGSEWVWRRGGERKNFLGREYDCQQLNTRKAAEA